MAPVETAVPQRHVVPYHKKPNIKSVVITFISFSIFASRFVSLVCTVISLIILPDCFFKRCSN